MEHDDDCINLPSQMIADLMRFTKLRFPHSQSPFIFTATEDTPDYLLELERLAKDRDYFEPTSEDEKMEQHLASMLALCEQVRNAAVGSETIGTYSEEVDAMRRFLRIR